MCDCQRTARKARSGCSADPAVERGGAGLAAGVVAGGLSAPTRVTEGLIHRLVNRERPKVGGLQTARFVRSIAVPASPGEYSWRGACMLPILQHVRRVIRRCAGHALDLGT